MMKRVRFTEDQIIAVLREHEAEAKTGDLARKHGVSEATLYDWKAKYGGLDMSEAKRLKALEDENRKLKKLLNAARGDGLWGRARRFWSRRRSTRAGTSSTISSPAAAASAPQHRG
jgi:putative transposase